MKMSDNKQKSMIHQLTSLLGIEKDVYKEMLFNGFKVESSKDLTYEQASELISSLKKDAVAAGLWEYKKSFNKHKFSNLQGRESNMASPKQLRMIEAMWADYSKADTSETRAKAFRVFLSKRFGVSDIQFIDKPTASKVIYTLVKMVRQKLSKAV